VIQELTNEINLMKDLKNEHIVQYYGTELTERHLYILLEYVPGGSIAQVLQRFKSLHESTVRHYTRQILFGLKFLHDRGIIHRDIKGANILVDYTGVIKLADFGHSKNLLLSDPSKQSIRGTPLWMVIFIFFLYLYV
jgi:serine/threonine protein kinase